MKQDSFSYQSAINSILFSSPDTEKENCIKNLCKLQSLDLPASAKFLFCTKALTVETPSMYVNYLLNETIPISTTFLKNMLLINLWNTNRNE